MVSSLERATAYARSVLAGSTEAPKYVKKQCAEFLRVIDEDTPYTIDEKRASVIDKLTSLMIMPKGLAAGKTVNEATTDFQWFFYLVPLCVVYKDDPHRRRFENVILEIARKNAKTFMIAVIFILLFFLEPKFSKFYSVAPDGKLSKEVYTAIKEIIRSSPALNGRRFKIKRDEIICALTENTYIPLAYSNDKLDGKLPSVFLVDEAGALPNGYAIEAMRSGQLTILNKLGCVISTKYPRFDNPFEAEIEYAKRVLDGIEEDDSLFALLYEPDETKGWETDDRILLQANPLAIDIPVALVLAAGCAYAIYLEGTLAIIIQILSVLSAVPLILFLILAYGFHMDTGPAAVTAIVAPIAVIVVIGLKPERKE